DAADSSCTMRPARRPIHLLATALCAGLLFAGFGVPSAGASTQAPLHPLGAMPPTHHVAPHTLSLPAAHPLTIPPASVNLKTYAMPIGNQGNVGSCVAWAVDYGMLGWYARKAGRLGFPFAPMFVYSQINGGQDGGAWPIDAFAVLKNVGSDTQAHY